MKSIKLDVQAGRRKGSGVVHMEGNLVLDNAEAMASCFRNAVTKYGPLRLKITSVEDIDLGFLQLLESLRRHQQQRGQGLELEIQLRDEHKALLRNTGFANLTEGEVVTLTGGNDKAKQETDE